MPKLFNEYWMLKREVSDAIDGAVDVEALRRIVESTDDLMERRALMSYLDFAYIASESVLRAAMAKKHAIRKAAELRTRERDSRKGGSDA